MDRRVAGHWMLGAGLALLAGVGVTAAVAMIPRTLSPRWFAVLARCPTRPLVREAGIAMTWDEVRLLERDSTQGCEPFAHRTKAWLTQRH